MSKEQKDELIEFQKKSKCNNNSGNYRKKAMFNEHNKDSINISSLIQSKFDKRAKKETVDANELKMEKLLALIEKEKHDKSTVASSVSADGTSQVTSEALKPALCNISGKANNSARRK